MDTLANARPMDADGFRMCAAALGIDATTPEFDLALAFWRQLTARDARIGVPEAELCARLLSSRMFRDWRAHGLPHKRNVGPGVRHRSPLSWGKTRERLWPSMKNPDNLPGNNDGTAMQCIPEIMQKVLEETNDVLENLLGFGPGGAGPVGVRNQRGDRQPPEGAS